MNYFDIIFFVVLAWAAYKGFSTGFIVQFAGLIAIFIGAWAAYKLSYLVADKLSGAITVDPIVLNTIAFVLTFIAVWLAVVLIGKLLNVVAKAAMLSLVNRLAGVVFSLAKVAFVISILLMVVGNLNSTFKFISEEQMNSSLLYKPIEKFAPAVFPYLKDGFTEAQERWNLRFNNKQDNEPETDKKTP